jgi:transposase-like protein
MATTPAPCPRCGEDLTQPPGQISNGRCASCGLEFEVETYELNSETLIFRGADDDE